MSNPKELVIKRSKWGRGETGGMLYDEKTGLKCCLGFLGEACGYSAEDMIGHGLPGEHADERIGTHYTPEANPFKHNCKWPDWLVQTERDSYEGFEYFFGTFIECDLTTVNDDTKLPEDEREKLVAEKFASVGVVVTFVD